MTPGPRPSPIRLSRAQVREVDRRCIEDYHLPGIVLMENAARAATDLALTMLRNHDRPTALIVCGGGNNGGDGLAVARHLHNRGVDVRLALAVDSASYRGDALINWHVAEAMKLPTLTPNDPRAIQPARFTLIIDALFGTGLSSPPRETTWIDAMNHAATPILAIDLPSGLDCDTGVPLGPSCVRATHTVTFVAEKLGFANPSARQYLGDVTVGDIGAPRELIEAIAAGSPA
jgi:NAD(P)H-hydrate epimerase